MKQTWLKLDNAAKLYPGIIGEKMTGVFRLSAYLKEGVTPVKLQAALDAAREDNPYFSMRLKKGLYWPYLEMPQDTAVKVEEESANPCEVMGTRAHPRLFRLLYFKNKISLETSHIISDGTGALEFFQNVLEYYFFSQISRKSGYAESDFLFDKYAQNCTKTGPAKAHRRAYSICGKARKFRKLTSCVADAEKVRSNAKAVGVTVGQYLCAIYTKAIFDLSKGAGKRIGICMPVNLRKTFSCVSPRNFFLPLNLHLDISPNRNIAEISRDIAAQMERFNNAEYFNTLMSRNLNGERNAVVRHIPLPLKEPVLRALYALMNSRSATSVFTNLGPVSPVNAALSEKISHIEFAPNPNPALKTCLGAAAWNGKICLTFTSLIDGFALEEIFFNALICEGLDIEIYSNAGYAKTHGI